MVGRRLFHLRPPEEVLSVNLGRIYRLWHRARKWRVEDVSLQMYLERRLPAGHRSGYKMGIVKKMTMKSEDIILRTAELSDAEELLEIYAPYVEKTAVTFEYEIPDIREFKERIKKTLKKYPYILAEGDGEILGYAYTGPFVGRAAYDWAVETTIYLKEDKRRMGIGKKLYGKLEEISKAQNILNMYACIACPEKEDQYLNENSVQFHEHLGYSIAGKFHKCGYKFGTWYNMVWMEKIIGKHKDIPRPVTAFPFLMNLWQRL